MRRLATARWLTRPTAWPRGCAALGSAPATASVSGSTAGTAEVYVAILGVLRAGAAYVPIDAEDPPARAERMLASVGAAAVVQTSLEIVRLDRGFGARAPPTKMTMPG